MTEFAWLIEAPGQNYLAVRELARRKEFHWTHDHSKAIRFRTSEQADDTMMAIRGLNEELFAFAITLGEAKPVEHGWDSIRKVTP